MEEIADQSDLLGDLGGRIHNYQESAKNKRRLGSGEFDQRPRFSAGESVLDQIPFEIFLPIRRRNEEFRSHQIPAARQAGGSKSCSLGNRHRSRSLGIARPAHISPSILGYNEND
jgi:hypothetical protein